MIDIASLRTSGFSERKGARAAVRALFVSSLLLAAGTTAHADLGDCSQPISSGAGPAASDCLSILKTAVGSVPCDPVCICAPKGTLPVSASDALLCLRFAVGNPVVLNCPCEEPTTTTTIGPSTTTTLGTGVVGAVPLQGRMNSHQEIGLPAATAACEDLFPGSHFCVLSEIVASEGAKLTGLEDSNGDPVTSFWAIDTNQSEGRQCGQTLNEGAPLWTYATAHLGVGGDSIPLDNATGTLGSLVIGGGGNRNCSAIKSVACCR